MKKAHSLRSRAKRRAPPLASAQQPQSPLGSTTRAGGLPARGRWTFLTNHSHVLVLLHRNPSMVLREVAALVGITERAVQRIIADLEEGGVIERERIGRQNHYRIVADQPLRHPIEAHRTIGELLGLLDDKTP